MRISDWSSDVCSSDLRSLPAWMRRSAKPELRIYGNTCLGWCSLAQLLRPVDGRDEHAQRILAQPLGIARRLNGDGENGRPALRAGELTVQIGRASCRDRVCQYG